MTDDPFPRKSGMPPKGGKVLLRLRMRSQRPTGPGRVTAVSLSLPPMKPVIYPNPEAQDDSDEEEGEDFPPPPSRPMYHSIGQVHQPVQSRYLANSSSYPVPGSSYVTPSYSSTIPPSRAGMVHAKPNTHIAYASPQASHKTGEEYYSDEDYIPPAVPAKASYGTVSSSYHPGSYKSPTPYQDRREYDSPHQRASPAPVSTRYPQGAPSKIMYTTPVAMPQHFVQSRPMNPDAGGRPPPPPAGPPATYANIRYGSDTGTGQVSRSHHASTSSPSMTSPRPFEPKSGGQQYSATQLPATPGGEGKEAEVDALTNLLLQNMEATADPDFFGMCAKCGCSIMGENTGCSALDQLFHIDCFNCVTCGVPLGGQPFFAMEGKPYCEGCYLNTLEKCSVCSKPIPDRILRATGKPYHPACFTCVVCGKSLDGVPFTVDATNQIHCIEDFHRKFAPRCCVCGLPIMPQQGLEETVRIVAMDKSFHVGCYKCEDCGTVLSSEEEGRGCYPLDDHILCKNCNAKRIQALSTKMTTEL